MTTGSSVLTEPVKALALSPDKISSIKLDGVWHKMTNCRILPFGLAEAHSPAMPYKFYPTVVVREEGEFRLYPLSQVEGWTPNREVQQEIEQLFSR